MAGNGENAVSKNGKGPLEGPGPINSLPPNQPYPPPKLPPGVTLRPVYTTEVYLISDPNAKKRFVNIMDNKAILRIAITGLFCVTGYQDGAHLPEAQVLGGRQVHKTREEVKALFPNAKWLEFKQGEASFMFCANDLPANGNSRMEVQGWVFRRHSKVWECVLTAQLNGVVEVQLSVEPKSGLFSAKGSADNKFKDKSVCTFDLRAGE